MSGVAFLGVLGDGCVAAVAAVVTVAVLLLAAIALITTAVVMRRLAKWEASLAAPVPSPKDRGDATSAKLGEPA